MSEQGTNPAEPEVKRTIKGHRPQFFADPAIDQLHGMVMAMATEMAVLTARSCSTSASTPWSASRPARA